ncbi:MAG: hypothetical protein ACMV0F_00770 [Trichlorobacter sp.]
MKEIIFLLFLIFAYNSFAGNSTYIKGPMLVKSTTVNSGAAAVTLTATSNMVQVFTGVVDHDVQLPAISSIPEGFGFEFVNESTGILRVFDSLGTLKQTLLASKRSNFYSANGSWSLTEPRYYLDELLDVDTGTPSEGNTLTFNSSTNKWVASAPQVAAGSAQWIYPWSASSTTNPAYLKLDYQPQSISEVSATVTVSSGTPALIRTWIYDSEYGDTSVPAGEWTVDFFASLDSTVGHTWVTATVFARTSTGTETSLFTMTLPDVNSTSIVEQVKKVISQAYTVNATDKIGVKVYANTDAATPKTLTFYWGDATHYSRYSGPFISRHNNLRGLQGGSAGEYYHLNQAKYNAAQNLTASGTMTIFTGDTQTAIGNCVYFGDSMTDGSHRSCQVGGALIYSKRVSGSWSEVYRVE